MPRSVGAARGAVVARREVRIDKDFYETPVACATEICDRMRLFTPEPRTVLEPSAGSGNFVRAIRTVWPRAHITAVDILASNIAGCSRHARTTDTLVRGDIMEVSDGLVAAADLVVGNPPFSHAEEHVKRLLRSMQTGAYLAFLLPTSFITTQGRAKGLWNNPPDGRGDVRGPYGDLEAEIPLAERPGFTTNGGTDMAEYCLYVWQKDRGSYAPRLLPHLWWHHRVE